MVCQDSALSIGESPSKYPFLKNNGSEACYNKRF